MDELLNVQEVAQRLHLHPATVRREINRGRLRAERRGMRKWMVTAAALREYEQARAAEQRGGREAAAE